MAFYAVGGWVEEGDVKNSKQSEPLVRERINSDFLA